jgi:hypothetical protein
MVAQICLDKSGSFINRRAVPFAEIVEDGHFVTGIN